MNTRVIHECTTGALAGQVAFPETVRRLVEIGVERYYADLVRLEKVFYGGPSDSCIERLPLAAAPAVAEHFDEAAIIQALRAIQQKRIDYPEFLRQIMAGGVASYTVFITGRHALYSGRGGERYLEAFPPA